MKVSVSIVSHGQGELVDALLEDLKQHCDTVTEVLLTINIQEELPFLLNDFPFQIRVIKNEQARGFAENHNAAFKMALCDFFCVLNPDIRLDNNPFPALLNCIENGKIGIAAPRVINSDGNLEDNARPFPTPLTILAKSLGLNATCYPAGHEELFPDWVAGMFMLFPAGVYREMNGFDDGYFLYYEDVDICARLSLAGYHVAWCSEATVVHNAQRASHNNLKYFFWHLKSITRFFFSSVYWRIRRLSSKTV